MTVSDVEREMLEHIIKECDGDEVQVMRVYNNYSYYASQGAMCSFSAKLAKRQPWFVDWLKSRIPNLKDENCRYVKAKKTSDPEGMFKAAVMWHEIGSKFGFPVNPVGPPKKEDYLIREVV